MTVANGTVYVAGTETDASNMQYPVLWTNGSHQRLTNGQSKANAHGIAVSGNDVYVSGGELKYQTASFAAVWKNGAKLEMGSGVIAGGTTQSYRAFTCC